MLYDLSHTTFYRYSGMVSMCQNQLRLTPRCDVHQQLLKHRIEVFPKPSKIHKSTDFFQNQVSYFELNQPHDRLQVTMHSQVRVDRPRLEGIQSPPWEIVSQNLLTDRSPQGLERFQFKLASPMIPASPDAAAMVAPHFGPSRPIFEAAVELNQRIHHEFRYDPNATTIQTPLEEVFRIRRGVCQDLAHVMLACFRSLGLAARYVSGYLRTYPSKDIGALVGADASHAWVSLYCGPWGWIDFDPTNNLVVSEEHVTLAWGRDFRDVTPINGLFVGAEQQSLEVAVHVKPLG